MLKLFSQRKAEAAKAGTVEVFQYDTLPPQFRVQVVHILKRATRLGGEHEPAEINGLWALLKSQLAETHCLLELPRRHHDTDDIVCWNYFLQHDDAHKAIDALELYFMAINTLVRKNRYIRPTQNLQDPDDAIADLNTRFRQHSIGYEFNADANQLIEVNSQYMHAEAVRPALHLLNATGFSGPQDEFLKAHKHYREGDYKAAVNEAAKALESTLKTICKARSWAYNENATAIPLIDTVLKNGLVESYHEKSLKGLRSVLESAGPTTRNQSTSSHGQGPEPVDVPGHLAAYVLHVTASNIVFLVESHRALK